MRICYVSHTNAHFTAPYVDYFAARGHDVHVISCHPQDVPNATNHHPAGENFDSQSANLVYFWLQRRVRKLVRRIQPDLLHAHYLTSNAFMAAMSGFHPLIVSARGSDLYQALGHPLKRRLITFAMNRADLVNPVSHDLEEKVLSLGIPREKVVRLTQGIDIERFCGVRSSRRPGSPRMICTRKLFPVYQCNRIVEALGVLAARGHEFEFVFAATGPEEAALRAQVTLGGLDGRVRFLGGYSYDALPSLLADADIYVSASRWDGTSPALLEAMAAGVFPVVSNIIANRNWLTGEGDSLLFDADDTTSLGEALVRALDEESLRRSAVKKLRRRVAEEGDRTTNLGKLAQIYDELCAKISRVS